MQLGTGAADESASGDARDATANTATADDVERLVGAPRPDDPTRTAQALDGTKVVLSAREDRVPAPLQYRDPERYEIVAEHGRGGLGRVFRARDKELGRDVAVKELLQRSHRAEVRFFREALITARLEHPGIVPVHEAGRWPDGTPFYAMKLVAGRPLSELIADATTLEERLALLPNVIAVADAIAYAHDRRIIHRDLKPSNVIVGEFGETVVIDWGLAKHLSEADDAVDEGPYRTAATSSLTVAGSVLGTPAYMAPEQREGFADERSDQYALGGILLHVVTGETPNPPDDCRPRGADFPAGVPRDLASVIARAMAPDPVDRYPTIRDLALDLRRFQRREPVRARRYTLLSRLNLGLARHRTVTVAATLALFAIAVVLAISLVIVARKEAREATARRAAEKSRREADDTARWLRIKNAELQLATDPTAAHDALAQIDADHTTTEVALLRARALGEGIAIQRSQLHADTVLLLAPTADGSLLSSGEDPKIIVTTNGRSEPIATDARGVPAPAVSQDGDHVAHLGRSGMRVASVRDRSVVSIQAGADAQALAISASGARVAFANASEVSIWQVRPTVWETARWPASSVKQLVFVDEDHLVLTSADGVEVRDTSSRRVGSRLAISTGWGLTVRGTRVAVGGASGEILLTDTRLRRPVEVDACDGAVNSVALASETTVAFACHGGTFGIRDLERGAIASHVMRGQALVVDASSDGRYVVAGGDDADVFVVDLETRITTRRRGHAGVVTAVLAPEPMFPFVATGDANGVVAIWDALDPHVRQVLHAPGAVYHATFTSDSGRIVADGYDGVVRSYDIARGVSRSEADYSRTVYGVRTRPGADEIVAWASDGAVYLSRDAAWHAGHAGIATDADFLADGAIVSVGSDGRVLLWSPGQTPPRVLLEHPRPLFALEVVSSRSAVVVEDDTGELVVIDPDGGVRVLARGAPVTMLRANAAGTHVAAGTRDGQVVWYDVSTGATRNLARTGGPIRHIAFSPDDKSLAVASEDGNTYLVPLGSDTLPWSIAPIRARFVAFSPDGKLLAMTCLGGGIYFYELRSGTWTFLRSHEGDVLMGEFSPDGRWFVSNDSSGHVLLHDVEKRFPASNLIDAL